MSGFTYDYYRSPYTGTIADLIRAPYDAQARNAEAHGAAAAQMGQGIATAVGATFADIMKYKADAPERALRAAQVAKLQGDLNDQRTLDRAYGDMPGAPGGPAGGGYYDATGGEQPGPSQPGPGAAPTREQVMARVPGHLKSEVQKHFDAADESAAKVIKAMDDAGKADADYFGQLGATVREFKYDPNVAQLTIAHAKETYKNNPQRLQRIQQLEEQLGANPDQQHVQQIADALIKGSPEQQRLEAQRQPKSDYARALDRKETELGHPITSTEELAFRTAYETASRAPEKPTGSDYKAALERYATELGHAPTVNEEIAFRGRFEGANRAPSEDLATKRADDQRKADFEEYKVYLGQYERTQPKSNDLAIIIGAMNNGQTADQAQAAANAAGATTPYKMPDDFNAWRLKKKGIGADGKPKAAAPVAPPPPVPPANPMYDANVAAANAPPAPPAAATAAPPVPPTPPPVPVTTPTPSGATQQVMVNGLPVDVTAKPQVGKIVKLKDGRYILVKTVTGDKFDGDELTMSK